MEVGKITISDSEKEYKLYYQCIEIEDSVYEEISNSNTTKERKMKLIPKYDESNWTESVENKFSIDTTKFTEKKAFAVWTKLISSNGVESYDVDIYSVPGTKTSVDKKNDEDAIQKSDSSEKDTKDTKDTTTATVKIPQTGVNNVIFIIICISCIIGISFAIKCRKYKDIK